MPGTYRPGLVVTCGDALGFPERFPMMMTITRHATRSVFDRTAAAAQSGGDEVLQDDANEQKRGSHANGAGQTGPPRVSV